MTEKKIYYRKIEYVDRPPFGPLGFDVDMLDFIIHAGENYEKQEDGTWKRTVWYEVEK